MAKYIIEATRLNDDGSIYSVSDPIEVDSDTINIIKIFDKTYIQEKHGRWEQIVHPWYECSECGERTAVVNLNGEVVWNFCPNCGADMREVEE